MKYDMLDTRQQCLFIYSYQQLQTPNKNRIRNIQPFAGLFQYSVHCVLKFINVLVLALGP